jgi:glycosyltransferase involved in cell wall biosynthesis
MSHDTEYEPLATCIILSYKKFDYLYAAIDSALAQTYPRVELIIADDGSENFPQTAVEQYVNERRGANVQRVHVYSNERNLGTVKHYNQALRSAEGEYFTTLASDDAFYDENVIGALVRRFQETGALVLLGAQECCDGDLRPQYLCPSPAKIRKIARLDTPQKQFRCLNFWTLIDTPCGAATYFSRECLERYGYFDESYVLGEDFPRATVLPREGAMYTPAFDLVTVRYRMGGMSQEVGAEISPTRRVLLEDTIRCFEREVLPYRKQLGFWAYRRARANHARQVARVRGQRVTARDAVAFLFAYNVSLVYWNGDVLARYVRRMLGMDKRTHGIGFE